MKNLRKSVKIEKEKKMFISDKCDQRWKVVKKCKKCEKCEKCEKREKRENMKTHVHISDKRENVLKWENVKCEKLKNVIGLSRKKTEQKPF